MVFFMIYDNGLLYLPVFAPFAICVMCTALRFPIFSSEWSYSDITATRSHFALRQRLATDSSVIDAFTLTR